MGCSCQQQTDFGQPDGLMLLRQLEGAGTSELTFFVQGVRTGLAIKAAEQAKWQRLGITLALTFGVLTFVRHWSD